MFKMLQMISERQEYVELSATRVSVTWNKCYATQRYGQGYFLNLGSL